MELVQLKTLLAGLQGGRRCQAQVVVGTLLHPLCRLRLSDDDYKNSFDLVYLWTCLVTADYTVSKSFSWISLLIVEAIL